jgi:hypothetical protein
MAWLGHERWDWPGRLLATKGATGLRHGGHRTRRRLGGCPGAGDSTRWRRAGEATAFRLAVLHRIDPSVAVSSDGGASGQWRRRRCRTLATGRGRCWALAALAVSSAAVSEAPTNADRAPKFRRSSLSGLDFEPSLESFVFAHAPKFSDRASFSGSAGVALRWSCCCWQRGR